MAASPTETIRALLETVLEELDDPDSQFRLRTALQLLTVIEEQSETARDALAEADLDPPVRDRLEELSYLD